MVGKVSLDLTELVSEMGCSEIERNLPITLNVDGAVIESTLLVSSTNFVPSFLFFPKRQKGQNPVDYLSLSATLFLIFYSKTLFLCQDLDKALNISFWFI